MRKIARGEIPVPSTEFTTEPVLRLVGSRLLLECEYDDGHRHGCTLVFTGVQAHVQRSEGACTAWHVDDAFDTICEVQDSPWVTQIEAIAVERGYLRRELHHYLIYLDSFGCCEAIATGWSIEAEDLG